MYLKLHKIAIYRLTAMLLALRTGLVRFAAVLAVHRYLIDFIQFYELIVPEI